MYRLATHFANLVCTPLNNITKRRQTILKMAVSVDAMLTMRNGDIGFGITSQNDSVYRVKAPPREILFNK